jgi:Na+-transporting NADH:ubiquinone oxidoreductase subunit NqrB
LLWVSAFGVVIGKVFGVLVEHINPALTGRAFFVLYPAQLSGDAGGGPRPSVIPVLSLVGG